MGRSQIEPDKTLQIRDTCTNSKKMPSLKKGLKGDQSYLTGPTKGWSSSVQRYSKKMGSVFFQMPDFNKRETYKNKQTNTEIWINL